MSQNIIDHGAGYRSTFSTRDGCPMSTKMNSPHMTTAEIARNSPRIVTRPNSA